MEQKLPHFPARKVDAFIEKVETGLKKLGSEQGVKVPRVLVKCTSKGETWAELTFLVGCYKVEVFNNGPVERTTGEWDLDNMGVGALSDIENFSDPHDDLTSEERILGRCLRKALYEAAERSRER
jgi:hypothetical protein